MAAPRTSGNELEETRSGLAVSVLPLAAAAADPTVDAGGKLRSRTRRSVVAKLVAASPFLAPGPHATSLLMLCTRLAPRRQPVCSSHGGDRHRG